MMHARTLGKHIVYTDHSLFGFDDLACVNLNKVLKSYLTDVDQMITVSSIGRDNLLLRAYLDPRRINVIPNAVDFTKFKPEQKSDFQTDKINIVSISRQTYRKGTDLLIEVVPELCNMFANVNFLIGGDGNKKILLDNMVQSSNLHDRVKLFGSLPHNKVRDVMIQGHIYLNTSLTEAFCIAIVEAASTGLYVVATDVGGVGEVLPENMMTLVKAEKSSIIEGVKKAVENYHKIRNQTHEYHDILKTTYNWDKVAKKTIDVYDKALHLKDRSILNRFKSCLSIGRFSGIFYLILIIIDYLLLLFVSSIRPKKNYLKEKTFDYEEYKNLLKKKINSNNNQY
jgi:phosphatidylinositol N-acetylglucosaminyltransferase subunit A